MSPALEEFMREVRRCDRLREEAQAQAGFDAQQWAHEAGLRLDPLMEKLTSEEILSVLLLCRPLCKALRHMEDPK